MSSEAAVDGLARLLLPRGAAAEVDAALVSVLEALPDGVVVVGRDGTVVYANAAAERLAVHRRRPPRRDLWTDLWEQVSPFDAPGLEIEEEPLTERAARGESFDDEVQHFPATKLGGGRWVAASARPIFDAATPGARVGGVLTLRDVTARRTAERALIASEERFRQLVDHMEEAFWVLSLVGDRMIYLSPAFERIWGLSVQAVYADPLRWLEGIHPDDRPRVLEARAKGVSAGRYDTTYRVVRPDGEERWVQDRGFAVLDARGEPYRIAGVFADVTELRRTQDELEARTEALARSNADLEKFAYVASHDLQEPLRMVASYTEILATEHGPALDEEGREYLGYARDGAVRMQRLIRDLLAFSRVRADRLEPRPVDLLGLMDRVLRDLGALLAENEAEVQLVPPLPTVEGDEGLLERLFANLVSNAAKYRGPAPAWIRISGQSSERGTSIDVEDAGVGISKDEVDRAFLPFQRLDGSQHVPGTGMGLAIARRIAEIHGGNLSVTPRDEGGSRFTLFLPTREGSSPARRSSDPPRAPLASCSPAPPLPRLSS